MPCDRLKIACQKCQLFKQRIIWCRKVVAPNGIQVDPNRIQGLMGMGIPGTAGDLMKFLNAANWIRTSIPEFAKVAEPMQKKLTEALNSRKRTKRIAKGIQLSWADTELSDFEALQGQIKRAVETAHPDPDAELLLMTDASEQGWSIVFMQSKNYKENCSIEDQEVLLHK